MKRGHESISSLSIGGDSADDVLPPFLAYSRYMRERFAAAGTHAGRDLDRAFEVSFCGPRFLSVCVGLLAHALCRAGR